MALCSRTRPREKEKAGSPTGMLQQLLINHCWRWKAICLIDARGSRGEGAVLKEDKEAVLAQSSFTLCASTASLSSFEGLGFISAAVDLFDLSIYWDL